MDLKNFIETVCQYQNGFEPALHFSDWLHYQSLISLNSYQYQLPNMNKREPQSAEWQGDAFSQMN
jgi:hypothetical protein